MVIYSDLGEFVKAIGTKLLLCCTLRWRKFKCGGKSISVRDSR